MPALDPSRRTALNAVKLRTLVEGRFGALDASTVASFGTGAALSDGARAFVLPDDRAERSIGPALAWADAQSAVEVHVLVDEHAGDLARRADYFTVPPTVWQIDGRALAPVEPAPIAPAAPPGPAAAALGVVLEQAGLDVVIEHGALIGEVLGLEVARVVEADDGTAAIEVGVGRHDREAFAIVHGDVPTTDALRSVIDTVAQHRSADLPHHPLNGLSPEKWLLHRSMRDPELFGSWRIARESGPIVRQSVKDVLPAFAAGTDDHGEPVVVAASVGVDLDLLPAAADARAALAPDARLVVVVPQSDALPVTERLAARLRRPAELVAVPGDWRVLPTLDAHDRPAG
jgi:hypothetical protein